MGRAAVVGSQPAEMAATDLWSEELLQEFIGSEESGQHGTIAHSYATVINKHGSKLNNSQAAVLQAIVFSSKIGLSVQSKEQAEMSISSFTGLNAPKVQEALNLLQNEFNIIEWDKNFQLFDILGDAVPRTQFLSFLRQRVASSFDEQGKAELFAGQIAKWCDVILNAIFLNTMILQPRSGGISLRHPIYIFLKITLSLQQKAGILPWVWRTSGDLLSIVM